MLKNCINQIASEDNVELIFREGVLSRKNLSSLEEYCIAPINEKWGIVSVPVRDIPEATYETVGYSAFPNVYGLSDVRAVNNSGVRAVREQPNLGLYGEGTYIAVIDTGINWQHEAFVNRDKTTKIQVMWDQNTNMVYTDKEINFALQNGDDEAIPGDDNGHGTFVAGIAAGNMNVNQQFSGVAPLAKLIVVKLKPAKQFVRDFYGIKNGAIAYSETDLMLAVAFVENYAEEMGLNVSYCIGVGSNLGSHAGTSPLCDLLGDVAEKPGRCVTIAAGNEGIEKLHFRGKIERENGNQRVEINVAENEKGFVCELWSDAPEIYTIEIISPTGQIINRVPSRTGSSTRVNFIFEDTTILIFNKQYESRSGKNLVVIRFKNPAAGIWTLNVYGRNITSGNYNMWIMNREFIKADTYFLTPDPLTTICEPGNAPEPITVVAYDSDSNSSYIRNGRGFSANGGIKPDFAAPGVNMYGPSANGNGYEVRSGSSIAAGFYSGMAALIMEYGIVRGRIPYLRTSDIKNITISGCIRQDGITYPSPVWGYGRVNLYNSIELMRVE